MAHDQTARGNKQLLVCADDAEHPREQLATPHGTLEPFRPSSADNPKKLPDRLDGDNSIARGARDEVVG